MGVKRFPTHPARPERLCWGCDRYCASEDMLCGNGSVRTPHPSELFGPDWDTEADEVMARAAPLMPAAPSAPSDAAPTA